MKALILILSLFLYSCAPAQVTTYTVHKGKTYCEPSIGGQARENLSFYFTLKKSWNQLYLNTDNSTHKISGISDLFGRNSLRLGVRRAESVKDGLIACPYIHNKGVFSYTAFKDSSGKNLLLNYDTKYLCIIKKIGNAWDITLYKDQTKIAYSIAQISMSSIGRRISGMYVEVGSGPSLWDIQTDINFIKP